jgi:hypothetical protein
MTLEIQNMGSYIEFSTRCQELAEAHQKALAEITRKCSPRPLSQSGIAKDMQKLCAEGMTPEDAMNQISSDHAQAVRDSVPVKVTPLGVATEIFNEIMGIPMDNRGAKDRYIAKILLNAWKIKAARRTDPKGITVYVEA